MKDISKDDANKSASGTVASRRIFLKRGGGVALGLAAVQAAGLTASAIPLEAYAANFSNLSAPVGTTLMRMARDIFPHDKLDSKYYAAVIESYDQKAPTDAELKKLISTGVSNINAAAVKRFGKPYAEIASEGDRVVLLYAIEQTPFFQKVRGDLLYGLYNNKEVWSFFGFEGSSWEKGGYRERGFDNIDWL